MKISRHAIAREDIQFRYDHTLINMPTFLNGAKHNPNHLPLLISNALDVVAGGSVLNADASGLTKWLEVASQACSALFKVGSAPGGIIEVAVGEGEPARYHRLPDASLVNARRWIQGFTIAAICRDVDALDVLCETPSQVLRSSSTGAQEYVYQMVEAFKAFWLQRSDAGALMLKAMESTDTKAHEFPNPDYVLKIDVPLIELLFYVRRRDPDFEKALINAVELHKLYWTEDDTRKRDWDGFIALGPLGLASLAFLREMRFVVDSEYLPMSFVRGDHLS